MATLLAYEDLEQYAANWHQQNIDVVLTNGCFDLIHVGHLQTFREAKKWGDILVVGINSDRSVRTLKGASRPIISQDDRCALLSALEPVDFVTVFDDDTAAGLLERIRPRIYIKGGDYCLESLPEKPVLERLGVKVVFIPLVQGISTSQIIRRIKTFS